MLELVAALWAVYGLAVGFLSGVLGPVIDGVLHLLINVGLMRVGGGYCVIAAGRGDVSIASSPREEIEEQRCDPPHSGSFSPVYTWPQWERCWTAICETSEIALSPLLCWPDESFIPALSLHSPF